MADARALLDQVRAESRDFAADQGALGTAYDKLDTALGRVLAKHVSDTEGMWCLECCFSWPCRTVRAISKALEGS